jgi:Carboxypeptidase regulatory-like domain/TonB dependent receptor
MLSRILVLIICLLASASLVFGQGTTGQISGTVIDQQGAIVQGASVKVTNLDTNQNRTVTTNNDGVFSFQLLQAGKYKVDVEGKGFVKNTSEVVVNITQTTNLEVQLSVSGVIDTVTVDSGTPLIQSDTSTNGRVVTGDTLSQLPLPTRNFQQVLTLSTGAQSGVSNTSELGRGDATISVNGQRTTSNSVRINGIDANSIGTNSTPNIAVPATDSLQEFIVQTSLYDASNGRNAGGSVEAITRSGSNDFHGSAYVFYRPDKLTANEPFIKGRGLAKPVLDRKQYGGTFGGRIVRDRGFFFGSYQGTKEKNGMSLNNSLTSPSIPLGLTDSNRTSAGILAAFGITPNAVALNVLNAKLPNGNFAIPSSGVTARPSNCAITVALASCAVTVPQSGVSTFKENQFNLNGDFNFSNNHTLAAKFFFADNPTFQANYNFLGLGNGERQLIGFGGDLSIKQKLYSITDSYIFSPNVVNQVKFGYNDINVKSTPEEPFTAASLGITSPLASLYPGAPTIRVLGADSAFFFGGAFLADQASRVNAYTAADTLSVTAGNHRLKFGGEFRQSKIDFFFNAFSRGQILFPSFNAFLAGGSFGTSLSLIGSGVFDRKFQVRDYNGFVQDDWKINNRLTINLGMRYDLFGLPVESKGRIVNFIPSQLRVGTTANPAIGPNGFVQAENGTLANVPKVAKTLTPMDRNNIAPRVGFAYLLDEDLNITVRGGYGVYYDRISTRYANTQLFNFPYFALGVGLPGFTNTFASPFLNIPLPSTFPVAATLPSPLTPLAFATVGVPVAGVFASEDLATPYIQQYNIGLQWNFAKNYLFDIGYVGNKGTKLLQMVTLNQPVYNRVTNTFTNPLAPSTVISANKNVTGGVQQVQTTSLSNYNSLQMSLTRRFNNGLNFLTSYTIGKSIDYYSGAAVNELANVPGDQFDWKTNRGRSDFNREQRLVISGVYTLPKLNYESSFAKGLLNGWQVAGIVVFQSGLPFTIVDSNDTSVISRANYNQGFNGDLYTTGNTSQRLGAFFNTTAFTPSRFGSPNFDPNRPFGNSLRNLLTGPGQKNVDISFIKFVPFTEKVKGEFRAEFFNVLNQVNYANPNNNIAGANFGRIERAATGPRVIQLAFKLSF